MYLPAINRCITGLSNHWKSQQVHTISDCHDFFDKDGHVESRDVSQDGIHLSFSGTKRLLLLKDLIFYFDFSGSNQPSFPRCR